MSEMTTRGSGIYGDTKVYRLKPGSVDKGQAVI